MEQEVFGHYRLDGLLGRGCTGEVHRAYDTRRERAVALKLLPRSLAADRGFRDRFRREAAVTARLRDPHVIPIHDFGEIDGRLFLDMRLVEGDNLSTILARDGLFAAPRAIAIIEQVAAALDAAHRDGLVHRDVKPSNVLVAAGRNEFVYLADFGLAGVTTATVDGSGSGSVDYLAPECLAAAGSDHRVDIYALGCMLYEALTGRKPFPVTELPALLEAHLQGPPPRPSERRTELPGALDDVVGRAMAKDPARRYDSAGALAADARAALVAAASGGGAAATLIVPSVARPLVGSGTGAPDPAIARTQIRPAYAPPPATANRGSSRSGHRISGRVVAVSVGAAVAVGTGIALLGTDDGGELAGTPTVRTINASCTSSASRDGSGAAVDYAAAHLTDGLEDSAWRCDGDGIGQYIDVTFASRSKVSSVGLIPGYAKTDTADGTDRYLQNRRVGTVRYAFDNGQTFERNLDTGPSGRTFQWTAIPTQESLRVRITILRSVPGSSVGPHPAVDKVAISELSFRSN